MSKQVMTLEMAIYSKKGESHLKSLASTKFHALADKASTLKTDKFKELLTSELPNLVKTTGKDGFSKVMKDMELKCGEEVSFNKFWQLILQLSKENSQNDNQKSCCPPS
ncbi:protein S100-A13-like isoform X2 [Hoplias malabaricus]|uniref:protein S100-A13-like isoform X2 n=1 Tax=Hoplias malabaricus TaxID=27720 RepID=UPI00346253B7